MTPSKVELNIAEINLQKDNFTDEETIQTDFNKGTESFGQFKGQKNSKQKKEKIATAQSNVRQSTKRLRSILKETISTMVKKQEKYIENQQIINVNQNRNLQKQSTIKPPLPIPQPNQIIKQTVPVKKQKGRSSANQKEADDDEESEPENALENLKKKKRDAINFFKMDPLKYFNEDGTEKFVVLTRLMKRIQRMKDKPENQHSDDDLVNSFDEEASDPSEDEEDESKPRKAKKKGKAKKAKKVKKKSIIMNAALQKPKNRKPIMNVYCTDYDVVKKAAKNMCGFRIKEYPEDHDGAYIKGVGGQKLSEDWDVSWHNLAITADFFSKMQLYQKVSQFPGIQCISKKHNLCRNLMKMKRVYPEQYKFFPRTWILPQEASEFHNMFIDKYGRPIQRAKTYIVKPDSLCQGRGIYLSRNYEKIVENCSQGDMGWVVQEYLHSPHLIEGLKYDLRIYVLLYGLNPLRIYIHEQGIGRFATENYEKPKPSNLDNMYVHLTNYAINKSNVKFVQNNKKAKNDYYDEYDDYDDEEEETGHKRSLFAVLKLIYQKGGDPDKIWDEIKDIVVKTIVVGQPSMNYSYKICQPECLDNSMCFQVLGFDILIDKNFKPWLLEVNQSPSFGTDSPLDYEVKKSVLKDTFNLLNISMERREEIIKQKLQQDQDRIMTGKNYKVSWEEREKQKQINIQERIEKEMAILQQGSGFELLFPQIYDEERHLIYEQLLKGAQDIWDDFTTGKNRKRNYAQIQPIPNQMSDKKGSQKSLEEISPEKQSRKDSISDVSSDDDDVVSSTSIEQIQTVKEEIEQKIANQSSEPSFINQVTLQNMSTVSYNDEIENMNARRQQNYTAKHSPREKERPNLLIGKNIDIGIQESIKQSYMPQKTQIHRKVFSQRGNRNLEENKRVQQGENILDQESISNVSNPQGSSTHFQANSTALQKLIMIKEDSGSG